MNFESVVNRKNPVSAYKAMFSRLKNELRKISKDPDLTIPNEYISNLNEEIEKAVERNLV